VSEPVEEIEVGVFGVGSLGQWHAEKYHQIPGAHLVGVFDADFSRAQEIAAKYETKAFESAKELAKEISAASVVVPTDLHREVAGWLLEEGKHLLVEKPIASTTEEAEQLVELAKDNNLILQVGHVERFNPVLAYLDTLPGEPRFIEAHRLAAYPVPKEPGQRPRGTEVSVVMDLMIHDLEVILHLVKSPLVELRAVGMPVLSPSEDICNVRLQFENDCVANITASRISPERMRKIRVFYNDAYISLDYQDQSGEMYKKTPTGIEKEEVPIQHGDALSHELQAFVACVRHHAQPLVTGEHASEALRLATRITRAIRETSS
jgi:predicted dehydrogenase